MDTYLLLITYLVKVFVIPTHVVVTARHFAFVTVAHKRLDFYSIFPKAK